MNPSVAVVGATGAVGEVMRRVLIEHHFPLRAIKFLASERSVGKKIDFQGKTYVVEPIRAEAFVGVDIVLSSTPASVSRESSPIAAKAGAIVVDNSSAWRMDPEVPLVVPEVNADTLHQIPKGIVANPNCSTIQMVVALKPLHDLARIQRVVVATYQASSGKGAKATAELEGQLSALGRGQEVPPVSVHAAQLAGNVLPHDWKLGDDGYSEEEIKMIKEAGATVSLATPSDMRIGFGLPPVSDFLTAGIPCGVSVDTSALIGNSSLFGVLRAVRDAENARTLNEFKLSARRVLELGTIEGARSMGIDDKVGSLTLGDVSLAGGSRCAIGARSRS